MGGFWRYAEANPTLLAALDRVEPALGRPPVFRVEYAHLNVLCRPGAPDEQAVLGAVPESRRHRWYRSMRSSQALAQSVFANLRASGRLELLRDLVTEDGERLVDRDIEDLELEHVVDFLGEERGRETNVDALLRCSRGYRVAFECKLAEEDVGRCSRPQLRMGKDANYERDRCDGSYSVQAGRKARCSLTAVGIRYWEHVPALFTWSTEEDHATCPLRETYQLSRNVIAACVQSPTHLVEPNQGHAVLLYDARNPAFREGGPGLRAFEQARCALRNPARLRRCTWQAMASRIREDPVVDWLGAALQAKYGI
jgi:hypothetical protein